MDEREQLLHIRWTAAVQAQDAYRPTGVQNHTAYVELERKADAAAQAIDRYRLSKRAAKR